MRSCMFAAIGAAVAIVCVLWLAWSIVGSFVTDVFDAFLNLGY